jgi:hypothetical protein
MSRVGRVPAKDCRNFLEFPQFNKPKHDGLTQLVILMDRWLGFLFALLFIGECQAKTLMKLSFS